MNENQGKRPDQLKYSEKVIFFCFVGIIIIFAVLGVIDIINSR